MSRERLSARKEKRKSARKSMEIGPNLVHFVEEASAAERALTKHDDQVAQSTSNPNFRAIQIEKAAKLKQLPQETPRDPDAEVDVPSEFSSELFKMTTGKRSHLTKGHANARVWVFSQGVLTYIRPVAPGSTMVYEAPDGKNEFREFASELIVKKCDAKNDTKRGRFAFTVEKKTDGKVITLLADSEELRRQWILVLTTPPKKRSYEQEPAKPAVEIQDSLSVFRSSDSENVYLANVDSARGLKDKPLPAVPPIYEELPQGGCQIKWKGQIKFKDNTVVPQNFELHLAYGELSGQGTDTGVFSFNGNYNKWGQMKMSKKYPDRVVEFKGVVVGKKYIGEVQDGNLKGTFSFDYVPHIDDHHYQVEDGKRVLIAKSGPPDAHKSKITGPWDQLVVGKKYEFTIRARDFKGEACSMGHAAAFSIKFEQAVDKPHFSGSDALDKIFELAEKDDLTSSIGSSSHRPKEPKLKIQDVGKDGAYRFALKAKKAGEAKLEVSCGGALIATPPIKFLPAKASANESFVVDFKSEPVAEDATSNVGEDYTFIVNVNDIYGNRVSKVQPDICFRWVKNRTENLTIQYNGKDHVIPYVGTNNLDPEFDKIIGDESVKWTAYANGIPVPRNLKFAQYFKEFGDTLIFLETATSSQEDPDTIDARRVYPGTVPTAFSIYLRGQQDGVKSVIYGEQKSILQEVSKLLDARGLSITQCTCRLVNGNTFDPQLTMGEFVAQYETTSIILFQEAEIKPIEGVNILPWIDDAPTAFTIYTEGFNSKKKIFYKPGTILSEELKKFVQTRNLALDDFNILSSCGTSFEYDGMTLEEYLQTFHADFMVMSLKTETSVFEQAEQSTELTLVPRFPSEVTPQAFTFVMDGKKHSVKFRGDIGVKHAFIEVAGQIGREASGFIFKTLEYLTFDPVHLTLSNYVTKYHNAVVLVYPNTFDVSKLKVNYGKPKSVASDIHIVSMTEVSDGSWDVTVRPDRVGNLLIDIQVAGTRVLHSPFTIKITPGAPFLPKTKVEGFDPNCSLFKPASFTVETFDALGHPVPSNLNVYFSQKETGVTPDKNQPVNVKKNKCVTQISFEPRKIGQFFLHIFYENDPIPNSPFKINISRGGPEMIHPASCFASGTCLSAMTVGEQHHIEISVVDKAGNVTEPGATCEIKFDSPNPPKVTVGKENEGKIPLSVVASQPGEVVMRILINGQDIRNSPLLITATQSPPVAFESTFDFDKETVNVKEGYDFNIYIKDALKGAFTGKANVELMIASVDQPFLMPEEIAQYSLDFDESKGMVRAHFVPFVTGTLLITPLLDNEPIQGAPFATTAQ